MVFYFIRKSVYNNHVRHLSLHIKYSVSYEWQAQIPIAFPIGINFLTEQNHKIERISDLVVVIKKLTKTREDATFRRMSEVAGTGTLHLLNAPLWIGLVIFAVGWIGTFFVGRLATVRFLGFTDPASEIPNQLRSVGLFAWLAGVLVVLIFSIGSFDTSTQGIFEVFGILTSGIYSSLVRYFLQRVKVSGEPLELHFPVVGSVLLVAIALLRLLIFAPSLHL